MISLWYLKFSLSTPSHSMFTHSLLAMLLVKQPNQIMCRDLFLGYFRAACQYLKTAVINSFLLMITVSWNQNFITIEMIQMNHRNAYNEAKMVARDPKMTSVDPRCCSYCTFGDRRQLGHLAKVYWDSV